MVRVHVGRFVNSTLNTSKHTATLCYGLTHSAFGLYGRLVVLLRLWYSHSLTLVSIHPLSWYTHPQGNFTSLNASVASTFFLVAAIRLSHKFQWYN
jgi:hypothetical protein